MAQDAQQPMTEEQLQAHLNDFLAAGAGMAELEEELIRLGVFDPVLSDDGKTLFLADEEVAPESDRGYWNIRDDAAKKGRDPQDVAEWVLRRRRELWNAAARAQRVFDRNLRQLKAWLADEQQPWKRFASFAEFVLREYADDFAAGESKINLVDGQLVRRKNADLTEWDDDGGMLEAAKRLRALPADATDAEILKVAKTVFSGYKPSALKDGLKAQKRQFVGADGKPVGYVYKVAPDEPYSFKIVQAGVGTAAAEDAGHEGSDDDG